MIKTYYLLTKPGIIFGNIITVVGGFALATKEGIDFPLFFATVLGLAFVIASACVINNYIDRHIDAKMERTKNRALAQGLISSRSALVFAISLSIAGIFMLAAYTNFTTLLAALTGFFVYVVLYGLWKSRTIYATAVGSVAGAMPPVVGYCAVNNRFDAGALILFLVMVLWQMPHFFAIAVYHLDDYKAASVPVLPVKKGAKATKRRMLFYIIAFAISVFLLTIFGYTGFSYLIVVSLLSLIWLWLCAKGFNCDNDKLWARTMFLFSLLVITAFCAMISITHFF